MQLHLEFKAEARRSLRNMRVKPSGSASSFPVRLEEFPVLSRREIEAYSTDITELNQVASSILAPKSQKFPVLSRQSGKSDVETGSRRPASTATQSTVEARYAVFLRIVPCFRGLGGRRDAGDRSTETKSARNRPWSPLAKVADGGGDSAMAQRPSAQARCSPQNAMCGALKIASAVSRSG